ncbi:putative ATP-dependent RNA helicase, partial [Kineosphaera limosa NBRC 100340]
MSARRPITPARAGKKPRWSAAKKSAVRGRPAGGARFERREQAGSREDAGRERGQGRPERDNRNEAGGRSRPADRSGHRPYGRADRSERTGDGDNRRTQGGWEDRGERRTDDRGTGRWENRRDNRGQGRWENRGSDRSEGSWNMRGETRRDNRRENAWGDRDTRSDNRGQGSWGNRRADRDNRDNRDSRDENRGAGRWENRDSRRSYGRDDRGGYNRPAGRPYARDSYARDSYGRDDRREQDRGDRRPYHRDDRGGRPSYDRPATDGYAHDRRERGSFDRSERRSFDRGPSDRRSYDRGPSDRGPSERGERRSYDRDFARPTSRDERPRFDRDDRGSFNRDDRGGSYDRGPRDRSERRTFERDDRRSYDREERRPAPDAQRLRNTEKPVVETVEVADDNGFALLGVPDQLVRRLAREGITAPFPIQSATIPDALAGRDVLGRGRTGSGKTLAFGLPMLTRLAGGEKAAPKLPRAVVLVPTRELAMQVSDALQPLVHVLGLRHKLVAGGMPYPPQFEALDRGVDVLIATPGRLADLIERGACSLAAVEIVVLDEADHMAEMGFLEDVTAFLDQVPAGGQRLLFSATLDRGIDGLVENYLTDPVTHSTDDGQASVTTMDHHILLVEPAHKKLITADVANRTGRTVVFVRTKLGADRVAEQLREQGVFAAALHGGLNQGARNRVLAAFKSGELPVLVATDVAARGIHVDDVSVVLQVDPPADHKDYLHRAGRTARAGEAGTVVTLALPHQRKLMERIAEQAGLSTSPVRVRVGDDRILEATGARRPSGVPIPEDRLRRMLEPPRRHRAPGRPGGGRRFGGRD